MRDEFTYDGTEVSLENLLIWWATREPFVHTDNCQGDAMHCCQGKDADKQWGYGVESAGWKGGLEPIPVTFVNNVKRTKTEMKPGDKIVYLGQFMYMLEQA